MRAVSARTVEAKLEDLIPLENWKSVKKTLCIWYNIYWVAEHFSLKSLLKVWLTGNLPSALLYNIIKKAKKGSYSRKCTSFSLITDILLLYCSFSWFCSLTCLQVLICRNYMGDMDMNEIDHFMPILMKREEEAEMTPLVSHGPSHFLWIKHSNLYRIHIYICITRLYKVLLILKSLLWLLMCLVITTLGGLACSVSCASFRFTPASHISAAGSSSDSVRPTSVWSVRHTCTLLIQRHIAVPQITDLYLFYFSLQLQFALF